MNLHPNSSAFATEPWNNPMLAPFVGLQQGELLPLGEVSETTAIGNEVLGEIVTPQGPINMLMETRSKFPYLAISPLPSFYRTVRLTSGVATDIRLPGGLVMFKLKGSAPYLFSLHGNASLPQAGDGDGTMSIYMPDGEWFYCGNTRSFSVIAPDTGTLVSVVGQHFHELPQ